MDDNKTLKIVGITCGVLLALTCCCGIGAVGLGGTAFFNSPPKQQTDAFLDDLAGGNYAQALQRMNGAYQSTHDVGAFQQAVATLPALTQHTDHTMNQINIAPPMASIGGTLDTPSGAATVQFQVSQQGEYWYIDSVVVNGVPLQ